MRRLLFHRLHYAALALILLSCTLGLADRQGGSAASASGWQVERAANLHALMINGGGSRGQNYQSHLLHVRELLDLLRRAGVPTERIAIFSSDGEDPAEDLAVREVQPEADFDLLRGTRLERPLRTPIVYADSWIKGATLAAATKSELRRWFEGARKRLRRGDTLLLYVTDHGTKNSEDTSNNLITLWGKDESLSVSELTEMLELLDPGVSVVALMSQCYSGAFAHLASAHATDGLPSGAACGYFSSTAERPAYGCYPENRGRENIGHSFEFIKALAATPRLTQAHDSVLVTDRTPDVPLKSSDVYLQELLGAAAKEREEDFTVFVDALLHRAWRDKADWEPEIRLLDRIGHSFGSFSPRSLAELDQQAKRLPEAGDQLRTYGRAWRAALVDVRQANLDRFLAAHSAWKKRLSAEALAGLEPSATRELTAELLADFAPFTRTDLRTTARLRVLDEKASAASQAAYRMEVRAGAVLRMRAILTTIAGRVHLATRATRSERTAYEALRACEDLTLASAPLVRTEDGTAPPEPFPPYDEDVKLAEAVLPAWMGIRFRQANAKLRETFALEDGAAAVVTVYPDSPAKAAGFEIGDVVIGPPGAPFGEPNRVREWTMLSKIGERAPLVVLRDGRRIRLTLVPQPYPLEWPELPGPPKVGSATPKLDVAPYRGKLPASLAGGKPHLLFFWATWCAPCKAALAEVLAFESERRTPVIAITDEPAEQLDAFFKGFDKPFPARIAVDEYRRAFLAYGVSGTPTFVLVDGDGKVLSYSTGYSAENGLGVKGWSWAKGEAPSAERD